MSRVKRPVYFRRVFESSPTDVLLLPGFCFSECAWVHDSRFLYMSESVQARLQ
jgi:hypothetical protein